MTCGGGGDFTAVCRAKGGATADGGGGFGVDGGSFADGAFSGSTEALGGGVRDGFGIPGQSFFDCFGMDPGGFGSSRGAADDEPGADAGDGAGGVGGAFSPGVALG